MGSRRLSNEELGRRIDVQKALFRMRSHYALTGSQAAEKINEDVTDVSNYFARGFTSEDDVKRKILELFKVRDEEDLIKEAKKLPLPLIVAVKRTVVGKMQVPAEARDEIAKRLKTLLDEQGMEKTDVYGKVPFSRGTAQRILDPRPESSYGRAALLEVLDVLHVENPDQWIADAVAAAKEKKSHASAAQRPGGNGRPMSL